MKKLIACLLTVALALTAVAAMAEGTLTFSCGAATPVTRRRRLLWTPSRRLPAWK